MLNVVVYAWSCLCAMKSAACVMHVQMIDSNIQVTYNLWWKVAHAHNIHCKWPYQISIAHLIKMRSNNLLISCSKIISNIASVRTWKNYTNVLFIMVSLYDKPPYSNKLFLSPHIKPIYNPKHLVNHNYNGNAHLRRLFLIIW